MNIKLKKVDAILIVAMIIISGIVLYQIVILPEKEKVQIPEIQFIQDIEKRTLTVKSFSQTLLWSDLEIKGECDKSDLGEYVTKEDKIKDCSGNIEIIHGPTGAEIGIWTFPPAPELPYSILLANEKENLYVVFTNNSTPFLSHWSCGECQ